MTTRLLLSCGLAAGLILTNFTQAHAQADPIKFGKLDPKDFDAKNFVADSGAEAVILCDFGRSRIDHQPEGFLVVFDRVTRIKILKKSGYDWATVRIPLYKKNSDEEQVKGLKGFTYNMVNGELVKEKLESSGIFSEQVDANHSVRKFTLPNVKEGSVIEFTYSVTSDFVYNFQDWQFQQSIPVRWSEYRANIPEYFNYKMLMQGYEPLALNEHPISTGQMTIRWSGQGVNALNGERQSAGSETLTPQVTNHRWAMKDVPAFRDEPFMTTRQDYIARINFELAGVRMPEQPYQNTMGTWAKINDELMGSESFGMQLNRAGFLKAEVAAIVAKYPNPEERAFALVELAKRSIAHNGDDELSSDNGIRKAFEQHRGSTADVNLLLIALLRDADLVASPLILSTRNHGRIDESVPLISRFNYVMAHVALPEGKELLLDATDALAMPGLLPERCLNTQGRLITKKAADGRWLPIASAQRYVHFQMAQLVLDERGGLSGKVHDEHGGYQGLHARTKLHADGEKKYVENNYLKPHDGWEISKYTFQQKDMLSKPLALDLEVKVPGGEAAASTIYLSPMRYFGESRNPFLLENRLFPVDFGAAHDETLMLTYTLPAGYEVEELPKSLLVSLPDNGGRFQYSVTPGPRACR
ncbi:hypothetical protein PK28_05655 [Hymenobacter sp. DG25B]|uniref:DUF3857 domain-containing protein n=1 Tax=Hymenobacter sp. DG25B TaxID=1385664 RepID=UPI000541069F|nr:DUF3857 domain-containing protein [Hymenobacter sp. DG25B]AIZ63309.1 hypothetical protein PK28_05655 [Hymenobacter sp. DG25B]